jgi:glycosyltransferase involved in cell wall biosynthesis
VGRPIIAAAAGGPLEIVTDGTDGLLTPPGDAEALASAMNRLADDPDLGRRLVEAARAKAHRFAPEVAATATQAVYDRVARRRRRP